MIKTDLAHHYKDRTPIETVNLIKNFFLEKGYTLKEKEVVKSECETFGT